MDSAFSLEPEELRQLVIETERGWQAIGKVSYGPNGKEKASLKYRRSIYIVTDLKSGETLTTENIRTIRPGMGLPPSQMDLVLGKRVNRSVERGTPLSWDLIG